MQLNWSSPEKQALPICAARASRGMSPNTSQNNLRYESVLGGPVDSVDLRSSSSSCRIGFSSVVTADDGREILMSLDGQPKRAVANYANLPLLQVQ